MTIYYYDDKDFNDIEVFRIYLLKKYLTKHYGENSAKKLIVAYKNDLLSLSKELGAKDVAFFAEYFLTNKFVASSENTLKPLAKVHYEIFDDLDKLLIEDAYDEQEFILPRGIGKSTIINSLVATWGSVYKMSIFTVVIGKTDALMSEFIDEVRTNLSDDYLVKCFGDIIPKDKNYANNSSELETTNGTKIQGITWGGSIRGIKFKAHRPHIIIVDDVLKEDDIRSENMLQRSIGKFYNEILPAGASARVIKNKKMGMSTKFIVIGTPLSQKDLINYIRNDASFKLLHKQVFEFNVDEVLYSEKWQEYRKLLLNTKDENRINTARNYYLQNEDMHIETIWSNYEPLKMVNKFFTERLSFMQEYMCDCQKVGEQWISYMAKMDEKEIEDHVFEKTILAIDTAASAKAKSDYFAFTILSKYNGFLFVRDGILKKYDAKTEFDNYINFTIELIRKYNINAFVVERNVFKDLDTIAIKKALEDDTDLKKKRVQSISVFNNKKKDDRIATITDKINSGTIIFNEDNKDYNQQVFDFCGQNYSLHDDAIDSLEMAVNHIDEIQNKKITLLEKSALF